MQNHRSGLFVPTASGSSLFLSSFWRTTLVLAVLNLAAAGVTLLAVNLVSELAWVQRGSIFADGTLTDRGILSLVLQVGLPAGVVLAGVAATGYLAVAAVLGTQFQKDSGRGSAKLSILAALWLGLQRALVFAGAFALVTIEIGATLALSPAISLAGIVLMLVFAVRRALGKSAPSRWFSWPMLVAYAIPLGLTVVIFAHSLLILPVAAFERHGVFGLLRRSSELVTGRALRVSTAAFCGVLGYAAVIAASASITLIDGAQPVSSALILVAQFTVAAFPVALLVAAYFDATGGKVPPEHALPAVSVERSPGFGVIAAGATVALLLGFIVPPGTEPAWAHAQPTDQEEIAAPAESGETQEPADSDSTSGGEGELPGGSPESEARGESDGTGEGAEDPPPAPDWWGEGRKYGSPACFDTFDSQPYNKPTLGMCFDSLGDEADATPGDGWCESTVGTCTLRAAVEELSEWKSGHAGVRPATAQIAAGTIQLTAPLTPMVRFGLDGEGLTIDGGQYGVQLFRVTTGNGGGVELANLTLKNGFAPSGTQGGAVQVLRGSVRLGNVILDNNHAADAGAANAVYAVGVSGEIGAISGRAEADGSSFLNNGVPACFAEGFQAQSTTIDADDPSCPGTQSTAESVGTTVAVSPSPASPQRGGSLAYAIQVGAAQTVAEPLAGTVTLYVEGQAPQSETVPSDGRVEFSALAPGKAEYSVRVVYSGSPGYRGSQTEMVVRTAGSLSTLLLTPASDAAPGEWHRGHPLTLTASVGSATDGAVPTGTVSFYGGIEGELLGVATVDGAGEAILDTTIISSQGEPYSGSLRWTLRAEYSGDSEHESSETVEYLYLALDPTQLTLTPSKTSAAPGESITFTARVSAGLPGGGPVPVGTVRFSKPTGGYEDVRLNGDGEATLKLNGLPYGTYAVSATYQGGSDRYLTSDATLSYAVTGPAASDVSAIRMSKNPSRPGDEVTWAVFVRPAAGVPEEGLPSATGTVRLMNGNTVLAEGSLPNLSVSTLPVGVHNLRIDYLGDGAYRPGSTSVSHTVQKVPTVVYLSRSPQQSVIGQPVDFSVSAHTIAVGELSEQVTSGVVQIMLGGTVAAEIDLSLGQTASVVLPQQVGDFDIRAVYLGNEQFGASQTSPTLHTQEKAAAEVALAVEQTEVPYVGQVQLSATVSGVSPTTYAPQTGTVRLLNNGVAIPGATQNIGTDGVARFSLDAATLGAGSHNIRAQFSGSSWFNDRDSSSVLLKVLKHTPRLDLAVDATAGSTYWGKGVQLDADVYIPWIPSLLGSDELGTIEFFVGTGGVETSLGAVTVTEQSRRASITATPESLPPGEHFFVARFHPSVQTMNRLSAATADAVPHTVAAVPVEIRMHGLEGVLPGESFVRSVLVTEHPDLAAGVRPEGSVRVSVDGVPLGSYPLIALENGGVESRTAYANASFPALSPGQHEITTEYLPSADGHHAAATTSFALNAGKISPAITLDSATRIADWGTSFMVQAGAAAPFDWLPAPKGKLIVTDGEGSSCEILVVPGAANPQTECALTWDSAGPRTVRAEFLPGPTEQTYEAATSVLTLQVNVRAAEPGLTLLAGGPGGSGQQPTAGEDVRLFWNLSGRDLTSPTGRVTLSVSPEGAVPAGALAACDTSTRSGTCQVPLTLLGAANSALTFTAEYAGDSRFTAKQAQTTLRPRPCVALDLQTTPQGAGTLTAAQAPNCGDPSAAKTGYSEGTMVSFDVKPLPSGDPSFDWRNADPDGVVDTPEGRSTGLRVTPTHNWAKVAFEKAYVCVPVVVDLAVVRGTAGTVQLPGAAGSPASLGPAPDCPAAFVPTGAPSHVWSPLTTVNQIAGKTSHSYTAHYLRGTEIDIDFVAGRPDTKVYAYSSASFVRDGEWGVARLKLQDHARLAVTLGPTCYAATAQATGPGAVSFLNAPNCAEPMSGTSAGTRGWYADTVLDVYARPDVQPARTLGYTKTWQGSDTSPAGATALPGGSDSRTIEAAFLRNGRYADLNTTRTRGEQLASVRVSPNQAAPSVTADFGLCYALTLKHGLGSDGSLLPDAGRITTPPDCPVAHAIEKPAMNLQLNAVYAPGGTAPDTAIMYFTEGAEVAADAPSYLYLRDRRRSANDYRYSGEDVVFGGWIVDGGNGRFAATREPSMLTQAKQKLVITKPLVLQPQYSFRGDCMVNVELRAIDQKRSLVSSLIGGPNTYCNSGSLESGVSDVLQGWLPGKGVSVSIEEDARENRGSLTMIAQAAEGFDPMLGWVLSGSTRNPDTEPKYYSNGWPMPTSRSLNVSQTVAAKKVQLPFGFLGLYGKAIACQQLDVSVNVRTEDGRVLQRYEDEDENVQLVMVSPAANCPYAANAWVAGTEIEVLAAGNPLGYEFSGWDGAVDVNTQKFDADLPAEALATIVMDGRTPSVSVVANYDIHCFDLSLRGYAGNISMYPEPNCPGAEGQITTTEYSDKYLLDRLAGTQQAQVHDYKALRKMMGPYSKTGRFIGGTKVLIRTEGVGDRVWTGWKGDVEQEGRINPGIVYVGGDSVVENTFRGKTSGEKLEDFGNDMAVFGKKFVGFTAAAVTEYLKYIPPIGIVTTMADVMSMTGMLLELAGVSKGDVAWLQYSKKLLDMPFAVLGCVGTWGMGSAKGEALSGAGLAAEAAKQKTYRITNITDQLKNIEDANKAINAGQRGALMSAKLKFYQARLGFARLSRVVGPVASTGMVVYSAVSGGAVSWDKDASSAWTDFSGYTDCLKKAVPDFIVNAFPSSSGGSGDPLIQLGRMMSDGYASNSLQATPASQPRRGKRRERGRMVARRPGAGRRRGSVDGHGGEKHCGKRRANGRCSGASGLGGTARRRILGNRAPISVLIVMLVPLVLAGCTADWDGTKELERAGVALPANTEPSDWATLAEVQVTHAESDGITLVGISGALEPDHALALCEEALALDPGARISVTDADGFPLAVAEPAGACEYDPILLEGLVIEEE